MSLALSMLGTSTPEAQVRISPLKETGVERTAWSQGNEEMVLSMADKQRDRQPKALEVLDVMRQGLDCYACGSNPPHHLGSFFKGS